MPDNKLQIFNWGSNLIDFNENKKMKFFLDFFSFNRKLVLKKKDITLGEKIL